MENAYPNLLSGIEICGKLFKNRLISTNSMPHYIQGDEEHPDRAVITHLANRAKNGAAVVTVSGIHGTLGKKIMLPSPEMAKTVGYREWLYFQNYDHYKPTNQNYFAQLVDELHLYGCRANIALMFPFLDDMSISEKNYPKEMIAKAISSYVDQALAARDIGFDMGSIHAAYGAPFAGSFLTPLENRRNDEYGGSIENRARICLELIDAIKTRVGKDFIIELLISGEDTPGGNTTEDYCEFLKLVDGLVDIVQVRMPEIDPNHPNGYMSDPNPTLKYAARFKELGLDMKIAPVGGFQDPEIAEAAIRDGKADMICAARAFICDPDYINKIREGCAEDIVPCIRCNKCHAISRKGLIRTACSVNPEYGIEHELHNLINTPSRIKKVAVVGGGPGGMEAAIRAAARGHTVSLFEKTGELGGALLPASAPEFKWPVKLYLDYLKRQLAKAPVEVKLNTEATPALIESERFDAVIIAVGGEPSILPIPGAEYCISAESAILEPERINGKVVVIGGGEIGLETAMHLCQRGFQVTILEMKEELIEDSPPQHFRNYVLKCAEETEGLEWILGATARAVNKGKVVYSDKNGMEASVDADTVVMAVGTKEKNSEIYPYMRSVPEYAAVGDCLGAGNIMTAVRSAFGATAIL